MWCDVLLCPCCERSECECAEEEQILVVHRRQDHTSTRLIRLVQPRRSYNDRDLSNTLPVSSTWLDNTTLHHDGFVSYNRDVRTTTATYRSRFLSPQQDSTRPQNIMMDSSRTTSTFVQPRHSSSHNIDRLRQSVILISILFSSSLSTLFFYHGLCFFFYQGPSFGW